MVIRFVAENEQEVVIESVGRDELGYQITRFLVLKKEWVDRPKRGIEQFWGLPKALDEHWYRSRGCVGNDVSVPYFRHPFSTSSFSFCLLPIVKILMIPLLVSPSFQMSPGVCN